uniref:Glycoprotein hormone subunit beta 5 n=1 Tax=Sinocyclocheilus rhinocerous TaxID=307959 RepID=A0A673JPL2_9TELE
MEFSPPDHSVLSITCPNLNRYSKLICFQTATFLKLTSVSSAPSTYYSSDVWCSHYFLYYCLTLSSVLFKPVLDPPFIESHQRVCTYNETRLETVQLPNCSADVDPSYTYPVALRCDCGVCLTSTTECITSV